MNGRESSAPCHIILKKGPKGGNKRERSQQRKQLSRISHNERVPHSAYASDPVHFSRRINRAANTKQRFVRKAFL